MGTEIPSKSLEVFRYTTSVVVVESRWSWQEAPILGSWHWYGKDVVADIGTGNWLSIRMMAGRTWDAFTAVGDLLYGKNWS